MFRFATGTRTGRPIQERPAHEFDHHRLQQCLFLWERALVFLSLLSPLLCRMPGRMRPLFQSAPGPHGTHALNGRRQKREDLGIAETEEGAHVALDDGARV
ncbi:MAG: hypothetical protein J0H24_25900, partial [Delftia acidovorans]|nr:hypothetical protein [Delftia acidovorans]